MTTPFPASRAGNTFQAGMATGKFHGVIRPTTPTGWRVVQHSLSPSSEGIVSPHAVRPWPATKAAMSTASCTSPPASTRILPASRATRSVSRALAPARTVAAAAMTSARAGTGRRAQACWAAAARATASSTSPGPWAGNSPTTSSGWAGFTERNVVMRTPFPECSSRNVHSDSVPDRIICFMPTTVADLIADHRDQLSPSERQVAEVVLRDPEAVAFGTVARVAGEAGTSGASVVRLATRLGYPGYKDMQAAVQSAIGQQLRPAAERIRGVEGGDVVSRTLRAELDNVHRTLAGVAPEAFARA